MLTQTVGDFDRFVSATPAFDKRDPRPAYDYGIGDVRVVWGVRVSGTALILPVYSGWNLHPEQPDRPVIVQKCGARVGTLQLHCDSRYHPCLDGDTACRDACAWAASPGCTTTLLDDELGWRLFDVLCRAGEDAFWRALEAEWRTQMELRAAAAAKSPERDHGAH